MSREMTMMMVAEYECRGCMARPNKEAEQRVKGGEK
jgi:hypothetical protein